MFSLYFLQHIRIQLRCVDNATRLRTNKIYRTSSGECTFTRRSTVVIQINNDKWTSGQVDKWTSGQGIHWLIEGRTYVHVRSSPLFISNVCFKHVHTLT